jgi:biotin operon repressor
MKFDETELVAAAMIGFDMIEGPNIKWYREFQNCEFQIDMESFLMNFYLSFRGGDEDLQPLAILYGDFYIVAFARGLELCCLFLRPENISPKIAHLGKIANELISQMDVIEESNANTETADESSDIDEVKRIVVNLLNGQEISTPELRRYFKLSNSEIWKIMSQLEENNFVVRTQKVGRTQFWTAV